MSSSYSDPSVKFNPTHSAGKLPAPLEFLQTMFGDRADDVHVAGFQGDPNVKAHARWQGGDAGTMFLNGAMKADASGVLPNIYFVPFNFKAGAARSNSTFESAVLIPVDDVGA